MINLWAAWIGIFVGLLVGAGQGLFFHRAEWLGGYGSWPRRLVRLGHVSFFGIAFINIVFFLTADHLGPVADALAMRVASHLLVVAAVLMPTVCYLAAWRVHLRAFFFLPVGCLLLGVLTLLGWGLTS
jgi:hypothetical protein